MVSFENTEIAFRSKSTGELRKAWFMFRIIGFPFLLSIGRPFAFFAARFGGVFRFVIKRTLFQQFCGGENLNDCEDVIRKLSRSNIKTILDYSVEGSGTEKDFENNLLQILKTMDKSASDPNIPFNVFKPSAIARAEILEKAGSSNHLTPNETLELQRVRERMETIFEKAASIEKGIMVDAEESWIQSYVDQLVLDGMRKYNREKVIVFNTFQMYRHDKLEELKRVYETSRKEGFILGIKLVRGAYTEKERIYAAENNKKSIVYSDKEGTDNAFDDALKFICERIHGIALCAGTHNEKSCLLLTELIKECHIEKNHQHLYFSQLYGMSDHISFNLSESGYNVVKYVPFGPVREVIPYLIRRAEENSSISGQSSRELGLLTKELKRRKFDK